MVCHRWTLAVIIICVPILVTVISAFRVRLPGGSHEVKSDLKKQKCGNCDVNELNLDQIVNSFAEEYVKRSNENLKKTAKPQPTFKPKKKLVSEEDDDDVDNIKLSLGKKPDVVTKKPEVTTVDKNVKAKKTSFVFEFDSDTEEDDSIDDDDDDDDEPSAQIPLKKVEPIVKITSKEFKSNKNLNVNVLVRKKDEDKSNHDSIEYDDDLDDDDDKDDDDDDDDEDDDDDNDDEADNIVNNFKLETKKNDKYINHLSLPEKDQKLKTESKETVKVQRLSKNKTKDIELGKSQNFLKPSNIIDKQPEIKVVSPPKMEIKKEIKVSDYDKTVKQQKSSVIIDKKPEIKEVNPPKLEIKLSDSDKTVKQQKSSNFSDKKPEIKVVIPPKLELKKEAKLSDSDKTIKNPKTSTKKDDSQEKDKVPKVSEDKEPIKKKQEQNRDLETGIRPPKSEEIQKKSVFEPTDKETYTQILMEVKKKHDSKEIEDKKKEEGIQFMSDSLRRRNLLQSEFEDLYAFLPTFAPNFSRIHNPECRRHGQILLRQLRGAKLWALNMLDATAKIPSGLLQGNGIQLGDFDQCLEVRARVQLDTGSIVKIQGKYCLAMLDLRADVPESEMPVYLAQAKTIFKSRIDDPGHFVPRFSTLSWGVCVPSPCEPDDVELIIHDAIKHYKKRLGVSVRVNVEEKDCYIKKTDDWEEWLELPTILTLSFYGLFVLLVLIATCQDYFSRRKPDEEELKNKEEDKEEPGDTKKDKDSALWLAESHPILDGCRNFSCDCQACQAWQLQCYPLLEKKDMEGYSKYYTGGILQVFSLYSTIDKLIGLASDNEIACIHGFRAVATLALLIAHKFLPVAVMPYTNRRRISEIVSSPLLSWCRAGWIFTDCFLLLSGALASYRKSKDESVLTKLLSKYLRLTPALLAVVLFYAYVWDNISVGPMWGPLVTRNAEICKDGWWWNVMYVQNYLGFDTMCAPQTHQLALDLQLTLLGGMILWMIHSEVPMSWAIMPLLHLGSAYFRYTTYRDHRLTALAYQGVSLRQLYRTGTLSYTSSFHRCTPYLIGLSLGMVLRNPSRVNKFLRILCWMTCASLLGVVFWAGADAGNLKYRYDVTFAAQYALFAPIAVSLAFAWLIYAVHNGYCDVLSHILCSRPLLFISRISYALYLIQFIVFLTTSAMVKSSQEFTIISLFDLQELSAILSASVLLTLIFIIPLQSLPRISFGSKKDDDEVQKEELSPVNEEPETREVNNQIEKTKFVPQTRIKPILAHREVLEEIPEMEIEYEVQRETNEGLEEILEEEEDALIEDMVEQDDDELEVIEEEQGGEDFWEEREDFPRSMSRNNDQDLEEWEWTANESDRNVTRQYRYSR